MTEGEEIMTNPATEKQIAFIRTLAEERKGDLQADLVIRFLDNGDVPPSTIQASRTIDMLKAIKVARPAQPAAGRVTEAGMYLGEFNRIFKVQVAVHGNGHLYAKELIVGEDGATFEYAPGALRNLRAEDRMTLEQAKQYGALYGTCIVCGRTLTNEVSIAEGIGPICSGRI